MLTSSHLKQLSDQVTSLRQFRVTCQEKAVEIQLRLRSPDANGRVMHFILRRQWGGLQVPQVPNKNGMRGHLGVCGMPTSWHQG